MTKRIRKVPAEQTRSILDPVKNQETARLREQFEAGYRANAEHDLELAAEWFPLEEEAFEFWLRSKSSTGGEGKRGQEA
jgi:hypothetical protein